MPVFNIPLTILVPVLLFALACFLLAPDSLTESYTTPAPATYEADDTKKTAKDNAEQPPDKAALPASLSGTEHGVILSAQQQQLVVHSSLRDLFDYYLSTLGERDNLWIDTQVRAALAKQLSGQPLAQAEHIWQQYLSYREQLALLPAAAEDASTYQRLQYHFDSRIALQDQVFGHAVAAALFAFDREQDALALQQLQHKEIKEQKNTSADNSNQQTLLNASYQQSWATRQYQQENAKTQQLLAIEQNTDDPAQRFAQRAAIAGEQQAVQLAALDQQRTQWQQQLTAFQQQVQVIKQQQLSADEEQKQIDLQLQQAFPPEQHLRVKALSGLL